MTTEQDLQKYEALLTEDCSQHFKMATVHFRNAVEALVKEVRSLNREAGWLASYISLLRCPLDKPFRDCEHFNPRNRDKCRECWREEARKAASDV